jgi:hypothetical protein
MTTTTNMEASLRSRKPAVVSSQQKRSSAHERFVSARKLCGTVWNDWSSRCYRRRESSGRGWKDDEP